jgi:hypothetical protein
MNNQKELYFSDNNLFSKITNILNSNGIKETPMQATLKGDSSLLIIACKLIKDLSKEKIVEKDFINSLQQKLGVDQRSAQNIVSRVKEEILPFAEAAPAESVVVPNLNMSSMPTVKVNPTPPQAPTPVSQRTNKDVLKKTNIKPAEIKSTGSDKYRESI